MRSPAGKKKRKSRRKTKQQLRIRLSASECLHLSDLLLQKLWHTPKKYSKHKGLSRFFQAISPKAWSGTSCTILIVGAFPRRLRTTKRTLNKSITSATS